MIKNQWYAIMESKEVKSKPVGVVRLNKKLVLWRDNSSKINCIYDKCCHRGASLSHGEVRDGKIQCPFHGFIYDNKGKVTTIPANGKSETVPDRYKVNGYKVKEAYGFIWLWYGDMNDKNIPDIPFFKELRQGFQYSTFSEVWNVHYTRAIENQLDVVHLPFVHETTIGKGNKTVVNGPVVEWEDNLMTFYVYNEVDDGSKTALKDNEIENYKDLFRLKFQMPNIWQNCISESVRIFAAFAPIDNENTKIYLRFYQRFLPLPIIGKAIAIISNHFNKVILHQDRRVVLTQKPKRSELTMDEKLIPGDKPIIEFRKRREFLKQKENT